MSATTNDLKRQRTASENELPLSSVLHHNLPASLQARLIGRRSNTAKPARAPYRKSHRRSCGTRAVTTLTGVGSV